MRTVARVLAGDRHAFRELVDRHSRSIFRLGFRVTGSEHDAGVSAEVCKAVRGNRGFCGSLGEEMQTKTTTASLGKHNAPAEAGVRAVLGPHQGNIAYRQSRLALWEL